MPVDYYGDPLPANAVARMGSQRFRQPAPYTALAFMPDGKFLASAGQDSALRVWDVATGKENRQFGIYDSAVNALAWSPDGQMLVTGTYDGAISFWDATTGNDLRQVKGHPGGTLALAFTSDGETLLSGGADNVVRLWDPKTGDELGQFNDNFGTFDVVAFAPDNTTLALGSWESTIRLCDTASGKEVRQFRGPRVGVKTMAFSPDGRCLAAGSADGSVGVWEVLSGKDRRQFPKHHDGTFCVVFSADSRMLASSGADTTILVWDVTGRLLPEKPQSTAVAAAQFPTLWGDLASDDAQKAYLAIRTLAAAAAVAAPFLKDRLQRLCPYDPPQTTRWLADLTNVQFALRERSTAELEKLGAIIEPALRKALEAKPPMEARRRLERLLAKIAEPVPVVSVQQAIRAVEALEIMGTPEARRVLDAVGRLTPETRVTLEARTVAERMPPA